MDAHSNPASPGLPTTSAILWASSGTVKILFLTHRLPYAPNRGDRIRAFHLIRHLTGCAEVSVLSLVHDSDEAAHVDELRAFTHDVRIARVPRLLNMMRGAVRLPTRRPLTLELLYAPTVHAQLQAMVTDVPPISYSPIVRAWLATPWKRH